MKLTVFLLIITVSQAIANEGYSQITLNAKRTPLSSILQSIKEQTGYVFIYGDIDLNQQLIDIKVENVSIERALDVCLKDLPLAYNIVDKTVVIEKKTPGIFDRIKSIFTNIDITGRVVDDQGRPIEGVTVTVKNTGNITTTDTKGRFVLKGVSDQATIVISNIGFQKQELPAARNMGVIRLVVAVNELDEIRVIPYGQTTNRLSVGNISSVNSKEIEEQPVDNPLLALQGRVPGLYITQNNGIAGGGVTVRIQGQNSLENGNDPLYVVDGVPIVPQLTSAMGGTILGNSGAPGGTASTGIGNPLSYINPTDIESIVVLKDADATSIYGSRAANGAIIITTKKGKAGPTKIDINVQQGVGKVSHFVDMLNTPQYLEMRREALKNDGLSPNPNSDYDLTLWDTSRYTNWQKVLIGGTAQYQDFNGSITGGSAFTQYMIGATYHRQTNVFPGNFDDRKGSMHFNINSTSENQKFNVQFTGSYMLDDNKLPNVDRTSIAVTLEPDAPPLYNANGTLNWAPSASGASSWNNPISGQNAVYNNTTSNLISNAILSYKILPGLDVKSSFGYSVTQTDDFTGTPLSVYKPELRALTAASAMYGSRNMNTYIVEPQATYARSFGKGKADILLGSTLEENNAKGEYLQGIGFNSDQALQNINSAATITPAGSFISQYKYEALFGRLNYNWDGKYLINLTARRDGSSRFGSENQFHDFESAGGAWIFSEENFIKNSIPILSYGKIRASYGTTGNDQIGDYGYLNLYYPQYVGVPYQGVPGLTTSGLPNPYLQWEATRKIQAGIDLGFLKDRILFDITYQHNRSSNQLLSYDIPSTTGFTSISANLPATVQNTSLEFELTAIILKQKDLKWNVHVNLTVPSNKLIAFPGLASSSYSDLFRIGKPVTGVLLFHSLGVDPATGQYIFADTSGKPTGNPDFTADRTGDLNTAPTFYGGLQNSFTYKQFQLDFLIQFVKQAGLNIYNAYNGVLYPGNFYSGFSNQPVSVLNRWQKPGDNAKIAAFSAYPSFAQYYLGYSDQISQNASFIRLKNVSLSYGLPDKWAAKIHLHAKIFLQGQNLLTFTKYKGLDPETPSYAPLPPYYATLPPLRVMTAGVHVDF